MERSGERSKRETWRGPRRKGEGVYPHGTQNVKGTPRSSQIPCFPESVSRRSQTLRGKHPLSRGKIDKTYKVLINHGQYDA